MSERRAKRGWSWPAARSWRLRAERRAAAPRSTSTTGAARSRSPWERRWRPTRPGCPPGPGSRCGPCVGQQTTGSKPREGYRLWPASLASVRVVATAGNGGDGDGDGGSGGEPGSGGQPAPPNADLGDLDEPDLAALRVGATLVAGPWPELGIGGLLWDGSSLVAIDARSSGIVASALGTRRPPIGVELGGLAPAGSEPVSGAPLVSLSADVADVIVGNGLVAAPGTKLTSRPSWVSVIGLLGRHDERPSLARARQASCASTFAASESVPRGEASSRSPGSPCRTRHGSWFPARACGPCRCSRSSGRSRPSCPHGPVDRAADDAERTLRGHGAAGGGPARRGCLGTRRGGPLATPPAPRPRTRRPRPPTSIPPASPNRSPEPPRLTLVRVPREHGP